MSIQNFSSTLLNRLALPILVAIISLYTGLCIASENIEAAPFSIKRIQQDPLGVEPEGLSRQNELSDYLPTAFYLESALGNRTLETVPEMPVMKSPNEAFLYSLVIPGAGQFYTGMKRGYLYAAAEVGFLATYFILRNSAVNTRDEYRDVVRENVIFDGPGSFENWDPIEDFEHATQYETWNHVYDSEETRARTGKWYWKDLDPTRKDEEDINIEFDSKHRLQAFELRQEANDTFERAKTVLGLVILNHVISAIDARLSAKAWNRVTQARASNTFEFDMQTSLSPGNVGGLLVVRKRF